MQAQNTQVDQGLYDLYTSPLYERVNMREQDIYTTIPVSEVSAIIPTQVPQSLEFKIGNKHYANVIQSHLSFQIGIPFTAGDLSGKTVIQQNCALYVCPSTDLTNKTLKVRLPSSSQGFFKSVQILKDNKNIEQFNFKQEQKFRENMFNRLTGQEWINRCGADIVYCNNNTRIIFKGADTNDTTTKIYFNVVLPLANISPIFSIWPYFPFELLNSELTLTLETNEKAFTIVGNEWVNYNLKMQYISQKLVTGKLRDRGQPIHTCFPHYYFIKLYNYTQSQSVEYKIQQSIQSLDVVQIQAFKNYTNDNYFLGFSNITQDSPYTTSERYSIGAPQFETNDTKLLLRDLFTWNDLYRNNLRDGNMLSQFNAVSSNKTSDYDYHEWINQFIFKLQDEQNISTTTSGYTGLKNESSNNTILTWKGIYDYSANNKIGVPTNSSNTVNYELFLYHSRFMTITMDGDLYYE